MEVLRSGRTDPGIGGSPVRLKDLAVELEPGLSWPGAELEFLALAPGGVSGDAGKMRGAP
jgi:hypothetical protein